MQEVILQLRNIERKITYNWDESFESLIKFKEINEKALSQCLMQFMLETIICGRAMGINPFGQHSVEERKILAREMMAKLQK